MIRCTGLISKSAMESLCPNCALMSCTGRFYFHLRMYAMYTCTLRYYVEERHAR